MAKYTNVYLGRKEKKVKCKNKEAAIDDICKRAVDIEVGRFSGKDKVFIDPKYQYSIKNTKSGKKKKISLRKEVEKQALEDANYAGLFSSVYCS